jgi:hypothetical protein
VVFHVLGDSRGVQDGEFQNNVAEQMVKQLSTDGQDGPQFCYHVGDVVYFTGMHDDYYPRFHEPYSHYVPPIFAIPGNHDGEVDDPAVQTSLDLHRKETGRSFSRSKRGDVSEIPLS